MSRNETTALGVNSALRHVRKPPLSRRRSRSDLGDGPISTDASAVSHLCKVKLLRTFTRVDLNKLFLFLKFQPSADFPEVLAVVCDFHLGQPSNGDPLRTFAGSTFSLANVLNVLILVNYQMVNPLRTFVESMLKNSVVFVFLINHSAM